MIEQSVDKAEVLATTSDLLGQPSWWRWVTQPLVGVGGLLLRRAVRAEQRTMPAEPGPSERRSYIPRDMTLSLFQAEHERHLREQYPDQISTAGEPGSLASNSVPPFSEGHGVDFGFVLGFLKALPGNLCRRIFFRLPAGAPREQALAEDARVVVVGDWGTGEGLALDVAARMREAIADAGDREVHVVHLGDVYYAGTRTEARTRFLDHWPVDAGAQRHRSWCLNGNHDMYSAGEGLREVILADPRFAAQRTGRGAVSTEFLLANRHWSLIGLDTSWKYRWSDPRGGDGYLGAHQMRWLRRHLDADPGRRTVLFSHHQAFTPGDDGDGGIEPVGNLLDRTAALRRAGRLTAWFWGHEHKLIAYGARDDVGYATCMGHGAILEAPAEHPIAGEFTDTFVGPDDAAWRVPGFAVLDLDGPRMAVRYIDRDGHQWRPDDVLPPSPADALSARS